MHLEKSSYCQNFKVVKLNITSRNQRNAILTANPAGTVNAKGTADRPQQRETSPECVSTVYITTLALKQLLMVQYNASIYLQAHNILNL